MVAAKQHTIGADEEDDAMSRQYGKARLRSMLAPHRHPSHGWIDPDGYFYQAVHHEKWAARYLKDTPLNTLNADDAMDHLLMNGWVRMVHDGLDAERGLNPAQFATAKKLAVGDDKGRFYVVDFKHDFDGAVDVNYFKMASHYKDVIETGYRGSSKGDHFTTAAWARKAARERGIEENPVKRGGKSPTAKRKCYLVQIHEGHAPKKFLPGDWVLWKNCRDMDECRDVALQRHIRIRGGVTKSFTVNIYVGSADDVGYDGNPRTAQVTEYRVEPQRLEDVLLPYEVNWARDRRKGAQGGD